MGLAERRAAKQFQDTELPKYQAEILALAGAVPVEVDWNQLVVDDTAHFCAEAWAEIFFKPVVEGLRQICRDEMGKEAVQAALKKIELRNSIDTSNASRAISFAGGTLTIDHRLANVDQTAERTRTVVQVLEKGL